MVTSAPGVRMMNALTSSPWVSCGTPTTAAIETSGWVMRTSSISRGYTLKPPRMTMSLARSTM